VTSERYLALLRRALTGYLQLGDDATEDEFICYRHYDAKAGAWRLPRDCQPHSLLRIPQLQALERGMRAVVADDVPGHFIEAGVYRGGAVVYMRAVLEALGVEDRQVWAADTFAGIPLPEKYPDVANSAGWRHALRSS